MRKSSEVAVTPGLFSTEYFHPLLQGNEHCSECESVEQKEVVSQVFYCRNTEVFRLLLLYFNVKKHSLFKNERKIVAAASLFWYWMPCLGNISLMSVSVQVQPPRGILSKCLRLVVNSSEENKYFSEGKTEVDTICWVNLALLSELQASSLTPSSYRISHLRNNFREVNSYIFYSLKYWFILRKSP